MQRIRRGFLWTVLLTSGGSLVPSVTAHAGICDHCTEEKRPRYIPVCDPCYGFHRTGWRPWNPENYHWHPGDTPVVDMRPEISNAPHPQMTPTPEPALPHWIPQNVPHRSESAIESTPSLPPLPDESPELAPAPIPFPTSMAKPIPIIPQGVPNPITPEIQFVGHSSPTSSAFLPVAPAVHVPASPYNSYRRSQRD